MTWAPGTATIQLPSDSADLIAELVKRGVAEQHVHVLELAVALGLAFDERRPLDGQRKDVSKVGQFDPGGFLEPLILDRYGDEEEGARVRIVAEHAEAGLGRLSDHMAESGGVIDAGKLVEAK